MNKDTELLKIQVYVGYHHSTFRVYISFVFGALVAIVASLMGLFLQKAISADVYYVTILICAPFFGFFTWVAYRGYRESLGKVDNMIKRVEEGDSLPSVKDLIRGEEKTTETRVNRERKKTSLYEQGFFLLYAAIFGLLTGLWGNIWATVFFEHMIRGDASLSSGFWIATIILIGMIAMLVAAAVHFYKKMKRQGLSSP